MLPTDLSTVIDPRSRVPECCGSKAQLQPLQLPRNEEVPAELAHLVNHSAYGPFCLRSHPGCIVFPGWLTPEAQLQIASHAFAVFPNSPAKTNHSARFGGLSGLWAAAEADQVLQSAPHEAGVAARWQWVSSCEDHLNKKGSPRPGVVTARQLLRNLRWSTLGPPYGVCSARNAVQPLCCLLVSP